MPGHRAPGGHRATATAEAPLADLHAAIAEYYTDKVTRFGATPHGVDWTCVPTQEMRFVQLLKLCDFAAPFSLNDLGCGYGALVGYLDWRHPGCAVDYTGIDLSAAMIRRARRRCRGRAGVRFVRGHAPPAIATWSVASGIFNVRLEHSLPTWEAFIAATLHDLHRTSARGFSKCSIVSTAAATSAHASATGNGTRFRSTA